MLKILSHEVKKEQTTKATFLEENGFHWTDFVLQIELEDGDAALAAGGTELLVTFNETDKDIQSYAFVPKNNPSRPTISVSLKDEEWEQVRSYCERASFEEKK